MLPALGARIRAATAADAEALALLHLDAWEDAYATLLPENVLTDRRATVFERIERWQRQLEEPSSRTIVAENETGLVGFATVGPPRTADVTGDVGGEQELRALYVRAAWWGRGIGHALLAVSLTDRPACLWVLKDNDRAIAFFRKHRFVEDGTTRAGHYGTEIRMVRGASG